MQFLHAMCLSCWQQHRGDQPPPNRSGLKPEDELCCWCGETTMSGISVHEEPWWVACGGIRGRHVGQ
jgi:hypothetical protein